MIKTLILLFSIFILVSCQQNNDQPLLQPYEAPNIYQMDINPMSSQQENIQQALKQYDLENETYEVKSIVDEANTVIIFEVRSPLTFLEAYEFDLDILSEYDFDVEKYVKEETNQSLLLGENLKPQQIVVILAWVPEGIPMHYLNWESTDGVREYQVLQYDGKGK